MTEGSLEVPSLELGSHPITLEASWEPFRGGDWENLDRHLHKQARYLQSLASGLEKRRTYKARDFALFLPPQDTKVGQVWALEAAKAVSFLTQLHPGASDQGWPYARGAFATLRAVSDTHLEVVFRIHAQFKLPANSSLTPGQFAGRIFIDRAQGAIDYFEIKVPTDNVRNVNFEFRNPDHPGVGSVFAPRMELVGGRPELLEQTDWAEELEMARSRELLMKQYYAFEKLEWVPFEEALERSRDSGKPVFAIVIMGVLNDQSC